MKLNSILAIGAFALLAIGCSKPDISGTWNADSNFMSSVMPENYNSGDILWDIDDHQINVTNNVGDSSHCRFFNTGVYDYHLYRRDSINIDGAKFQYDHTDTELTILSGFGGGAIGGISIHLAR